MPRQTYVPNHLQQQAIRSKANKRNIVHRKALILSGGTVSNIFTVSNGPVMLTAMFMRITTAVSANACDMAWVYDPSDGSASGSIGTAIEINAAAIGDRFWSELDGTAIIKVAAGVLMRNFSDIRSTIGRGLFVPEGEIDLTLSNSNPTTGIAEAWMEYEPIDLATQSKIWMDDLG